MIKRSILKVIIILIAINLFSCDNHKRFIEPEDLGQYSFNLLKSLSQTTKSDYVNSFITIEGIRKIAKNEEIVTDQNTQNELILMKEEEWIKEIEVEYNELKKRGGEYGIKWAEIEYLDFLYEFDIEKGIKVLEGVLFFKYEENSYSVDLTAVNADKEYLLGKIYFLRKRSI